jgi:UDP-N-acetylmuramate--alanine ligase
VWAREHGVPVVHRSEVLYALSRERKTIGVTGTHGKGTVSSMIAWILECAGKRPGFIIGGMLHNFGTNARDGDEWMVLEVDESDGSHRNLELDYVVCNFLELDHLNYYKDLDDIIDKMTAWINGMDRLKEAFVQLDCEGNRRMVEALRLRPTGYGVESKAEYRGQLDGMGQLPICFRATQRSVSMGDYELNLPGRYNVVNAMGAIAVARRIGIEESVIREALASYRGMENRFTIVRGGGVTVVKDYISHPTGMRKVLESARDLSMLGAGGKIYSIFKPYRYTLINYLKDEYGAAFAGSDEVIITKMYAAEEDPIPGVDTELVVSKIRENGLPVTYLEDQDRINAHLLERVRPGDQVIFFGGDDFFRMADVFVAELARRAGEADVERVMGASLVGGPLATE